MAGQVEYYDRFGKIFADNILNCPEPELWTTDYLEKGRVYLEMKQRVEVQEKFIDKYFEKEYPVLDIGCGFGRQAVMLGRKGFSVTGIDDSAVFIDIARDLFDKYGYTGEFIWTSVEKYQSPGSFRQLMLLDVLEHIPGWRRKKFCAQVSALARPGAILFLSLPRVRSRLSSRIHNEIIRPLKSLFHFFRNREEHPFPIPGKEETTRLFMPDFKLLEYLPASLTDYYIFQKRR